jgi:hypothetical protein
VAQDPRAEVDVALRGVRGIALPDEGFVRAPSGRDGDRYGAGGDLRVAEEVGARLQIPGGRQWRRTRFGRDLRSADIGSHKDVVTEDRGDDDCRTGQHQSHRGIHGREPPRRPPGRALWCRRKLGADGIADALGQRRAALVLIEIAFELTDELVVVRHAVPRVVIGCRSASMANRSSFNA